MQPFCVLQLSQNLQKLIKPISTFQMEVFLLEHHVIAILAPGCILPCTSQFDLLTGLGIFQLVALGFHQQHLSAVGHYDKVRVVVAESVQAERIPAAGGIAVPPAHTVNAGQCIAMSYSKLSSSSHSCLYRLLVREEALPDKVISDVSLNRGSVTILPTSSQL